MLEKITIQFSDNCYLFGLAKLLLYFYQHYKQLFIDRKLHLKYFKKIEIVFNEMDAIGYANDYTIQQYQAGLVAQNVREFFIQTRTHEYSTDRKNVEINVENVKEGIESFGTIYQNLFYWLQQIQKNSFEDDENAIEGCTIAFCF